jgi:hypothetical protein
VTLVSSGYPTAGTKTAVPPWIVQCPGIDGDNEGIGEVAARGAENCTRTALAPFTPRAPEAGDTETTCRGAAGSSGVDPLTGFSGADAATREAWLPGEAKATIVTPDARTSAALLAVRATPRFFSGLGTLNACQNRLAAEVPLPASDVCCLRNHPDPDTAPSLHVIAQLGKLKAGTLEPGKIR